MYRSSTRLKRIAGTLAVAGTLFAVPAGAASAAGTTLNPAGDNIGFGATSVNLGLFAPFFGTESCTMSGGSVAIPAAPANSVASGPITLNLAARPTFAGCSGTAPGTSYTVATAGTWSLKFQGGATSTATLTIPVNGILATSASPSCRTATNRTAITVTGNWQNGVAAPTFTPSRFNSVQAPYLVDNCAGFGWSTRVTPAVFPVVDLTSPTSIVSVF